jgi:uncharacterized protein YqgV (UPF0045/DUF77 family)
MRARGAQVVRRPTNLSYSAWVEEVMRAHEIIRQSGLVVQLHAYGTNVEGELGTILATIRRSTRCFTPRASCGS